MLTDYAKLRYYRLSRCLIHVGKLSTCLEKLLAYFLYLKFDRIILAVLIDKKTVNKQVVYFKFLRLPTCQVVVGNI